MLLKRFRHIVPVLLLALLVTLVPGCSPDEAVDSYIAVVPRVMQSGGKESISLTLLSGQQLVTGRVEAALLKEGEEILKVSRRINGKGEIEVEIPDAAEGDYEILVRGNGFEDRAPVRVEKSLLTKGQVREWIY